MELSRYTFPDAYIVEELRRTYHTSDTQGRICLLQQLYRNDQRAPFEVALLAVEDADVEVRQWIARHGTYLDYRASRDEPTDRNLEDRLQSDPDPFVRACLRENPTVFSAWSTTGWIDYFREATHLERLALMRNPEVGNPHAETLVHTIFDYEDQELDIALSARQECILAFLTNAAAVNRSRQLKVSDFIDGLSMIETREHFSHLWMLISRWPEGTGNLQAAVYRYLGAPDETKAEIYRTCPVPAWKLCILENCHEDDFQTIELGMQDADDQCRELAYTKFNPDRYLARRMAESLLEPSTGSLVLRIPALVHEKLQTVLQSDDKAALSGLAANRSLSIPYLQNVAARLDDLGDTLGVWQARQTIEEIQKIQPSEVGEEENGQWRRDTLDQRNQGISFAVSLLTIIEQAQNRFATFIEGSSPRFISDDGSKAFATDIELVAGLGKGSVWLDSNGTVRFSCEIVENNSSLDLVRKHLDLIVSDIVACLSQGWNITEDPLSEPYLPRLHAVHNHWKVEVEAHIIPRVDDTFDASLQIRARGDIQEIQEVQTSERSKDGQDTTHEEQAGPLDKKLLFSFVPQHGRGRTFPSPIWQILLSIWQLLFHVLEILIVLGVFSVVRTPFETITVSILIFIYFGMEGASGWQGRLAIERAYSAAFQFARIARLLHDPESRSYEELLQEAAEAYSKLYISLYITVGCRAVISLIAGWKLVTALL